jgi:hypothetical protein
VHPTLLDIPDVFKPRRRAAQVTVGWLVMYKSFWIMQESPDSDMLNVIDTCTLIQ